MGEKNKLVAEHFVGVAELGGVRGYALERVAHRKLASGGIFEVRHLREDGVETAEQMVELQTLDTIEFDKLEDIQADVKAYLKPKSKTLTVVDSMSIRKTEEEAGFQVTVSLSQGQTPAREGNSQQLGIKAPRIFRIYFVVPEDKFIEYKVPEGPEGPSTYPRLSLPHLLVHLTRYSENRVLGLLGLLLLG